MKIAMTKESISSITRIATLCIVGSILTIATASAGTTNYHNPQWQGNRLDLCLNWGKDCGKPAANAFCKAKGFDKSTGHIADPNIGAATPTRLIGTGALCDQGYCDGFKTITCYKVVNIAYFVKPQWQGNRLDLCLNWGQGCGKEAADAFCKSKGFTKVAAFSIAYNIGAATPTRLIGTGALCDQGYCDGFKSINCSN